MPLVPPLSLPETALPEVPQRQPDTYTRHPQYPSTHPSPLKTPHPTSSQTPQQYPHTSNSQPSQFPQQQPQVHSQPQHVHRHILTIFSHRIFIYPYRHCIWWKNLSNLSQLLLENGLFIRWGFLGIGGIARSIVAGLACGFGLGVGCGLGIFVSTGIQI